MIAFIAVMAGFFFPLSAASCCGGGSSASLVLPKFARFLYDTSVAHELYDGFWNSKGQYQKDPVGSDLRQMRINMGAAYRVHDNIQTFLSIPYVVNINQYTGLKNTTYGAGDITLGLNIELFNDIRCVYRVLSLDDLWPAIYLGAKVTVPTGISPYDNIPNSFDITGLGFYTFDFGLLLDKTIKSWNISIAGNYSVGLQRPVNMEYGRYIEPYNITPGDRLNLTASTGYTFTFDSMDSLTFTFGYGYVKDYFSKINGLENQISGFEKHNLLVGLAFATADQNNVIKLNNTFNLPLNGWGINKPATITTILEYSHVIR